MSFKEIENKKRFESKDGRFTIFAVFEGNYVRWSREEGKDLDDEEVSTIEEFNYMIQEEQWREV